MVYLLCFFREGAKVMNCQKMWNDLGQFFYICPESFEIWTNLKINDTSKCGLVINRAGQ